MSEPDVTITACILARNEERRIEEALQSLQGWTCQIIVVDNESEDATVGIARRYADCVLTAPRANNFDAARNLAIEKACGEWLFYLDADERVPQRLGPILQQLVREQGHTFEAMCIPFKHYFCGKWMEHSGWWPGYTRPQLLKKGRFRYNPQLHSGVEVDGRTVMFPAEEPDLAIVHYSYDDLRHYLTKLNNYTDGEAENLYAGGHRHSWQAQLAHFVHDWQVYYERGRADLDGMHGFILAFLSAFYRFASRAKLWDLRRAGGEIAEPEPVPASLREMLEFMSHVAQQGAEPWLKVPEGRRTPGHASVPLLWRAPLFDASGYADESRQFALGLLDAGEPVALVPENWPGADAGLPSEVRTRLERHRVPAETPTELAVLHTLLLLQQPLPNAGFTIARTMFETDGLPAGAAARLNAMDRVWVPSEFNRESFIRHGVAAEKIAVIPESLDPAPFAEDVAPWPVPGKEAFTFLSVFDWTLHKGWDVLLEAFVHAFGDNDTVGLLLKVWSTQGYSLETICSQADTLLRVRVGRALADFPNIHLWQERIPAAEMPRLYRAAHAFVLPTRGEGWCRPLMEAMAAGLPTIATAWSGLTAFHNARVGFPLRYRLVPVSAAGTREIPLYAEHCWAEPDLADLQRLLRLVVDRPDTARKKGRAAQKAIARQYSRAAITAVVREELARCRELAREKTCRAELGAVEEERQGAAPVPVSASPQSGYQEPPHRPNANPVPLDPIPPVDFRSLLGRPLRVRWEGPQSVLSSLALVNREFCLGLLERGDVEFSFLEPDGRWQTLTVRDDARFAALFGRSTAALSGPPDVTVRHFFPPCWQRPEAGKLVVMQPWEYGHLPRDWVAGALEGADEVWAYSRFVRDVYVRSGVPAEKVRVVPLGVRTEVFTPPGASYPLQTRKRLRFLYVGGAIDRKGADLLLAAYLRAFTAQDDVCLVVKDMGTRTFYAGQTLSEAFRRAQADPQAPEVIYLDEDLSEPALASLYRACSCVVLPYRGEGFGFAPLEGMASGLTAIVTAGGPTDDYLDDAMALRVPQRQRLSGGVSIGPFVCVGDPWVLEPDLPALVDALRWVRDHPEETQERGRAAREHALTGWTWERAVDAARQRLSQLVAPAQERLTVPATLWEPTGSALTPASPELPWRSAKRHRPQGAVDLSLCMIVRDEEPRIASCLRSVAPYVDEMVVVDTGSKDRTREIAYDCGARVFEFAWVDSFAAARNQSLEQARGAWIFWMDADDMLSPECGQKLRELIARHPDRLAAYQMQVRIPPGPGEYSSTVVDHVKLFPNRPDLRFEHRIHEQILAALRRAGIPIYFSDIYVTHENYDRSAAGQARKRQRDFHLLELDLADHPDHPFILFNLGMTHLFATKEFEVAAHYLRRSLDGSDWRDSIVRKAYALLTTSRSCQLDWPAAVAANEEGRSYYPDDAELLFQAGQVYQQVGRFEEARGALERLVRGQDDPHYRSVDVGLRTYRGWHELALLFRQMGDTPHCVEVLNRVVEAHPEYEPARRELEVTLQALGQHVAVRTVSSASSEPPGEGLAPWEEPGRIEVRLQTGKRTKLSTPPQSPPVSQNIGLARLARKYPYPAEKPAVPANDHGWLQEDTARALARQVSEDTRIIVELGSWLGRSTRYLAELTRNAFVIAVDHWQGSEEHHQNSEWRQWLPTLYETFLVNCWDYRERILPVRLSTQEGLNLIARLGIPPDLIYVDAAHDIDSVRQDLRTTVQLFPEVAIVGDDWFANSVQQGVREVVQECGLEARFRYSRSAWWLERA
jgi:glycosyltransferase involved in cell wall biosynthesis